MSRAKSHSHRTLDSQEGFSDLIRLMLPSSPRFCYSSPKGESAMEIGILRETREDENRLPLSPVGVSELVHHGAKICLETKAGEKCGYSDAEFEHAGAKICYSGKEVIGRSQVILKVGSPGPEEIDQLHPDQIVGCFW